jgi:hypothetical protein
MRLLLTGLLAALTLDGVQSTQTFAGVVSDDMCALDHTAMRMGPTDAECTHACVEEHDAAYVLATDTRVYRLGDQSRARAFAGRKVKVVGTLDPATNTIAVTSITGE